MFLLAKLQRGTTLDSMKALTRDQVQSRNEKAVRFTRDVLDDQVRADEIEDESLEGYAERRNFSITNPNQHTRSTHTMADSRTKEELLSEIEDLESENQDLQDQLDSIADIVAAPDDDEPAEDDTGDDADQEDDDSQD